MFTILFRSITIMLMFIGGTFAASETIAQEVTRAEIARVRYELSKVEQKLKEAAGQSFQLSKYDRKAFELVRELAEKDPDNPGVADLLEEAKEIYNATKGITLEITPEMLAYRTRQRELTGNVGSAGDAYWNQFLEALDTTGHIEKPFPVVLPPDCDPEAMIGKNIILEKIDYDSSLFVQMGRNWLPCGNASQGFYFVDASCREFNSIFEALRRYRDQIQNQIPPSWTIVGVVEGPGMLAPDGTAQRPGTPQIGWRVRPEIVHIPDTVTIHLDESHELGAAFVAEDKIEEWKTFSITSVPENVKPMELVEIYITAVKEKNWDLHLDCIDPEQREVGPQVQGLRYNWEVQQKGLERTHCHAAPIEATEIETTRGYVDPDLEDFFGDGKTAQPDVPKEERVVVTVRLFNEKGMQTVRPRFVTLIRRESGRWYIYSGSTLLF